MSLLTRISSAYRHIVYGPALNQRAAAGALVVGGPRQHATWPNYDLDGQIARGFRLAVVAACIDAIARDVSAAPLRVYREVDDQPVEEARHPARIVIREPNPTASESEFWHFVVSMAAATGFCLVEKVRSGAGRPVELWPLISPWLKVKPKPQAMPDWEYRVPGNDPWLLKSEDVILLTYRPDPWGGWTGRSPMQSLKRELAIADELVEFLFATLQRGGTPVIGLKVQPQGPDREIPEVSEAERDRILADWQQKYGGARNWATPAFLGGVEPVKIGLDLGEMLYPDVRDSIQTEVCMAFGVPSGLIGTMAGMARNTFSNYETSVRSYYDGTIAPLWARIDGAFTRGLLREFDPAGALSMGFDTSDIAALEEDEAPKWDQAIRGLAAALLTVDDARAHVGLKPFAAGVGDVLYLPFSAVVIRPSDLLTEAEIKPIPPALVPATGVSPNGAELDEEVEIEDDEGRSVRMRRLSLGRRQALHTRSKKAIAKLARQGAPKLRTFWKAQGARITEAAVRSVGADPATERRDLTEIDWDLEEAELAKVLTRFYALNGETAFAEVADQLGIDLSFDLANPNVKRLMNDLARRVTGISETTRLDVSRTVTEALEEGVTLAQLEARLTGLFEETYKSRAMTVSRTESQTAFNRASTLGYEESGLVAFVEMLDNPLHGDYDGDGDGLTCAQRNEMIVPLGQAQIHIEGTHPNCVLALAPVLVTPLGEE